jgi:hypothetical protein
MQSVLARNQIKILQKQRRKKFKPNTTLNFRQNECPIAVSTPKTTIKNIVAI